ncbi:MAG TPA: hypothetical protein VHT73_16235, partial [Thermodesulfobacteriota bacterium]|nr:hypothetical protein [Thermodesulfobacteriota bacterium]
MSEEKKSKVEIIKESSNGLRGTIREELERDSDYFSHDAYFEFARKISLPVQSFGFVFIPQYGLSFKFRYV